MSLLGDKRPWYWAGLAFECARCGRCCAGPEQGYVWVSDAEIAAIARHLGLQAPEVLARYVRRLGGRHSLVEDRVTHDCVFLQPDDAGNRRCAIYDVRPTQCRTWPFWPRNLGGPDDWSAAAMRCRGINRGTPYALDEIECRRKATGE